MASGSSNNTGPEDNQALTHKLLNLIINVGGKVYRHILDNEIKYRNTTLRDYLDGERRAILHTVPYKEQFYVLFPDGNAGAESADTFDIPLMAYLFKQFFIRDGELLLVGNYSTENFTKAPKFSYISYYDEQNWNRSLKRNMYPWNTSVIADIVRIKEYRNMIHEIVDTRRWLTEQKFKEFWNDLSAVLLNLGRAFGISNLFFDVEKVLNDPLDPQRENDLTKSIGTVINEQTSQTQNLKMVNEKVDKTWRIVAKENKDMDAIQKSQKRIEDHLKSHEGQLKSIGETVNQNELQKQKQADKQEHDNLAECSTREMIMREDSTSDELYVKTKTYESASKRLRKRRIVVLCGNNGEGKSTMALKLIFEHSVTGYRILKTPEDWRSVKCESCDVVLIDDIFGAAALAEDELKQWQRYFGEIQQAIKKGEMYVIMTVKHHILQTAKKILISRHRDLFDDENVEFLKSRGISNEERCSILTNHLNANDRNIDSGTLRSCLDKYPDDFPIGFPQCARLFSKITKCYNQGDEFFRRPIYFVKECLEDIFNEQNNYSAFTFLWAQPQHSLRKTELEKEKPDNVISVALKKFVVPSPSVISDVLCSHRDGFIDYREDEEEFRFSYDVIADVVGLIVFDRNIKDGIELCSFDFLLTYVTTESVDMSAAEKVIIQESRYGHLCEKLMQLKGPRNNVLLHDAFENDTFIAELAKDKDRTFEMFKEACVKGVPSLVRRLLQYHVDYKQYDGEGRCPIHLSAVVGHYNVVKLLLDHDREQLKLRLDAEKAKGNYKGATLLHIAVLRNYDYLLKELLQFGADLTARDDAGKTPLLLSVRECPDTKISNILLKHKGDQIEMPDTCGSTPLEEAIRSEKIGIAKQLCKLVKNLNYENKDGQTVLDIARQKGNAEIIDVLLKAGAKSAAEVKTDNTVLAQKEL